MKFFIVTACALTLGACQTTSANRGSVQSANKFQKAPSGIPGKIELASIPKWKRSKSKNGKPFVDDRGIYVCPKTQCSANQSIAIYTTNSRKTRGNLEKIKKAPPTTVTTAFAVSYALRSQASKKRKRSKKSSPVSYSIDGAAELKTYKGFPGWGATAFLRPENKASGIFLHSIIVFDDTTQHVFQALGTDKEKAKKSADILASAWRPFKSF